MGKYDVLLQQYRDGKWQDFAQGPVEHARQHIEQNNPGQWRAVDPKTDAVVIEPKEQP